MTHVEPPTVVQSLDISENGTIVATWLDRGVQKSGEISAVNMVFFLNMQIDKSRRQPYPNKSLVQRRRYRPVKGLES